MEHFKAIKRRSEADCLFSNERHRRCRRRRRHRHRRRRRRRRCSRLKVKQVSASPEKRILIGESILEKQRPNFSGPSNSKTNKFLRAGNFVCWDVR